MRQMVEGWLKDVGKMLKDIGRLLEGCWKNSDNEDEVDEEWRLALLSGWLESEMIDFS